MEVSMYGLSDSLGMLHMEDLCKVFYFFQFWSLLIFYYCLWSRQSGKRQTLICQSRIRRCIYVELVKADIKVTDLIYRLNPSV